MSVPQIFFFVPLNQWPGRKYQAPWFYKKVISRPVELCEHIFGDLVHPHN